MNSDHGCALHSWLNVTFAAPNLATSRLDTGREAWAFCSVQARHRPCLPECRIPVLGYYFQGPFKVQTTLA
jgi:hypothetical protein